MEPSMGYPRTAGHDPARNGRGQAVTGRGRAFTIALPPGPSTDLLRETVSRDVRRLQVLPLPVLDAVDADHLIDGVPALVEDGLAQRALVGRDLADGLQDLRTILLAGLLDRPDDDVHVLVGEHAVLLRALLVLCFERVHELRRR